MNKVSKEEQMKRFILFMLIGVLSLSTSCDLLIGPIETSDVLMDTRWQITVKPDDAPHDTLVFTTEGTYLFLDEDGHIFESGQTSNMTETSFEFVMETQRDRPDLVGADRYAEFEVSDDTLEISYYRDTDKSELFITFTASRTTDPVRIAYSNTDFSNIQGTDGLNYGYRVAPFDLESFTLFSTYDAGSTSWVAGDTFWTAMGPNWVAPNGPITSGEKDATEHRPTRRWTSPLDGTVQLKVVLKKNTANAGTDGVTGSLHVNGIERWTDSIDGSDTTGVETELELELEHDDVVEFVLSPRDNDWADGSYFTGEIWVGK